MKSKIYTKVGDAGVSSLFNGRSVPKYDLHLKAYGELDYLNVVIGFARFENSDGDLDVFLEKIQRDIFAISSILAGAENVQFEAFRIEEMEKIMDILTEKLPELHDFILPHGSRSSLRFHEARVICRNAERLICELDVSEKIDLDILRYINRLSDLFFMLARFANFAARIPDCLLKS